MEQIVERQEGFQRYGMSDRKYINQQLHAQVGLETIVVAFSFPVESWATQLTSFCHNLISYKLNTTIHLVELHRDFVINVRRQLYVCYLIILN